MRKQNISDIAGIYLIERYLEESNLNYVDKGEIAKIEFDGTNIIVYCNSIDEKDNSFTIDLFDYTSFLFSKVKWISIDEVRNFDDTNYKT